MAEMLVRLVDKVGPDTKRDAMLTKRGDVITIQDDGWPWSQEELSGGQWTVVKVPGATVAQLSGFLPEDAGDDVLHFLPRKRAFSFDIDLWEQTGRGTQGLAVALARKKAKPRLPDPSVLGQSTSLIG